MSGALYESMLVVDRSSTGAEILFLIEPWTECFDVKDLCGTLGAEEEEERSETLRARLVVKALDSDMFTKPVEAGYRLRKIPFQLHRRLMGKSDR